MKSKFKCSALMALLVACTATLLVPRPALSATRQMERLGRGVVAINQGSGNVYVSWRLVGTDASGTAFNLYRSTGGGTAVKLNGSPLTTTTDFVNAGVNTSLSNSYYVRPVVGGVEQAASTSFTLPANAPANSYLSVPLQVPPGGTSPDGWVYSYSPNDCSPADLDGDGEYEIVVKWDPNNAKDNSQDGYTGNQILDAYKLNGTRLWRIDLGRNIRAGSHYTQFMVYDLDGDGKAEVACKTADGTRDGVGTVIGSSSADYRNVSGRVLSGPEFFTIFNGQTGAALRTINYEPARGNINDWGDDYGNRVDRFLACIAYLDGVRPSVVMCRGYYTRTVLVAYDWRNGTLTKRWTFDTNVSNSNYAGEGNHQLSVGDVDGDGRDEIIYGACAIDDNGTGKYRTGYRHGDAMHFSDMDPDRPGLEVWDVHETGSVAGGGEFRNANTGALIWGLPTSAATDTGRGMAAHIDANHKGFQFWSQVSAGTLNRYNTQISTAKPSMCFATYWTGSLQRQLLNGTVMDRWNGNGVSRVTTFYNFENATACNSSKNTPNLQADIVGDWKEEVILHSGDNTKLLIFMNTTPATTRLYTLMHDPVYRLGIAWQNVAYNQPPHAGFYIGAQMAAPPVPNIYYPGTTGGSLVNGAIYEIEPQNAIGKRLDVFGASTANGAQTVIWADGNASNQRWKAFSLGNDVWEFEPQHAIGKALDVNQAATTDGASVIIWTKGNPSGNNQRWKLLSNGDGSFCLEPQHAIGKCLDVTEGSNIDGAEVTIWARGGTPGSNQRWKFLQQ